MELLKHISTLTLAVKSITILVLFELVHGDCPHAIEQMHACTSKLANITTDIGKDIKKVQQSCRNLMEVPICLEDILNKCQGDDDFESIESLKHVTNLWKDKLQKICLNISGDVSSTSCIQSRLLSMAISVLVLYYYIMVD